MMLLPLLLLLMAATGGGWMVAPVAGALGGCSYGYTSKSVAQAYLECLQYLNISRQPLDAFDETDTGAAAAAAGNCLVRCIGLTTRWWDDERGVLEPALLPHFRLTASHSNSPTAGQLIAQARQCVTVSSGPRTHANRCRAAYRSYRCYSDLLGELVAHPRFLPPRADELLGAVSECAQLLQLPEQRVARYVASSFLTDAEGTRLLRCIVLKLGLYSDGKGVLSERLVLLPGGHVVTTTTSDGDPAGPLGKAQQCETSVRDLGVDVCHLAAHSIEHCYGREAFGELWPLMMQRYVPDGTVPQQINVQAPTTPDTSTSDARSDHPAAVRSKLVYLRKHEQLGGTGGGAVPFEMVIADSDYREIARLLDSEGDQPMPPKVGEGEEAASPDLQELQKTELSEDTEEPPLPTQEQARKPRSDSTTGGDCGRDKCPDRSTL